LRIANGEKRIADFYEALMSYPLCNYPKSNGIPCGSPALRGQKLCYFHQREPKRTQQRAKLRRRAEVCELHFPPLNTIVDVQIALFEVMDALAANCIEPQRASALLFGLQQASLNLRSSKAA
jgi:hypothetical protein